MRRYDCANPHDRFTGVSEAANALRRGELVVLPTDTVYGLAADAFTPGAVTALLAAKGRGRDMPVPVLVASPRVVEGLALGVDDRVRSVLDAFWPGGLTVVLRHQPTLAWDLGDAAGTVALRMPAHPVALDVLRQAGPLAVSSANRSGQPPAATADQAVDQLGDAVAVVLDGGTAGAAVASTIVDLTGPRPRLLRVGAVPAAALAAVLPDLDADG